MKRGSFNMKIVEKEASMNAGLPVGSLVVETKGSRLLEDSVVGFKIDDTHVLALGEKEARVIEFVEGVDKHFEVAEKPSNIGIGLKPSLTAIINKSMSVLPYDGNCIYDETAEEEDLAFPDKDDDLYQQAKKAAPLPDLKVVKDDDKGLEALGGFSDEFDDILYDFSITKASRIDKLEDLVGRVRVLAKTLHDGAIDGNLVQLVYLIDSSIKSLKGKHKSVKEIADTYSAKLNGLFKKIYGDYDDYDFDDEDDYGFDEDEDEYADDKEATVDNKATIDVEDLLEPLNKSIRSAMEDVFNHSFDNKDKMKEKLDKSKEKINEYKKSLIDLVKESAKQEDTKPNYNEYTKIAYTNKPAYTTEDKDTLSFVQEIIEDYNENGVLPKADAKVLGFLLSRLLPVINDTTLKAYVSTMATTLSSKEYEDSPDEEMSRLEKVYDDKFGI